MALFRSLACSALFSKKSSPKGLESKQKTSIMGSQISRQTLNAPYLWIFLTNPTLMNFSSYGGAPMIPDILEKARTVLTAPADFYRQMPKSGGFLEPMLFLVVMAVIGAIIFVVCGLLGLGAFSALGIGVGSMIFMPVMAVIGSFIGGAIMFVIWKLMGTQEPFEVAYRCVAFASAIYPVTALIGLLPYLGSIVGIAWGLYLMFIATKEVHHLDEKTASMVFGIIGLILIVSNISSEMAARRMSTELEKIGPAMENIQNMEPEEAGKMVGEFLKGLEKAQKETSTTEKE